MSKKSFITELEQNGFIKMESDAYADSYGLNVVFEGNEMILADKEGYEIGRSSSEDLIRDSIITRRRRIESAWWEKEEQK